MQPPGQQPYAGQTGFEPSALHYQPPRTTWRSGAGWVLLCMGGYGLAGSLFFTVVFVVAIPGDGGKVLAWLFGLPFVAFISLVMLCVSAPLLLTRRRAMPDAAMPVQPLGAGWHPDPYFSARLRYWDGGAWTEHVHS